MKRTIAALVQNKSGVLSRITSLFTARGFNINSLTVGETENSEISRMTIVTSGDDRVLDQIMKQLGKLVEVLKVANLTGHNEIAKEHMLVKVKTTKGTRPEIIQLVKIYKAKIVDVNACTLIIELTGTEKKAENFLKLMKSFGIIEVVRSGIIAISPDVELHP